ncbi:tail fiber protein [Xenorhabdus cabanillasii JM26]|nr:tail fiber protein [Xenorhabdus cabanillasii JM26]
MVSTVKRDVTAANENANNRLEKRLNGADIPDKAAFVRNLGFIAQQTGFAEDKIISQKGVTDALNGKFDKTGGYVNGEVIASQAIKSAGRIAVANPNGFSGLDLIGEHYDVIFETNGEEEPYLAIRDKVREGTNYVTIPRKSGTMALLSDMDEKVSKCFGIAQKWVDVTAQRAIDTTYTNDTGRPIAVIFTGLKNTNYINAYAVTVRVDGVTIAHMAGTHLAGIDRSISFIVPPGSMYSCSAVTHTTVGFDSWVELR